MTRYSSTSPLSTPRDSAPFARCATQRKSYRACVFPGGEKRRSLKKKNEKELRCQKLFGNFYFILGLLGQVSLTVTGQDSLSCYRRQTFKPNPNVAWRWFSHRAGVGGCVLGSVSQLCSQQPWKGFYLMCRVWEVTQSSQRVVVARFALFRPASHY